MHNERMTTFERNQPPYYYTERMEYEGPRYQGGYVVQGPPPPVEKDVHVTIDRTRMGPCMTVLAIIFVLFIIILVICLIIFFTWGSAYRPNTTGGKAAEGGGKYGVFLDIENSTTILNALKANNKVCLLDTVNLVPNYPLRYAEDHLPGARHFDINKVTSRLSDGSFSVAHPLDFQTYARSLGIDNDCPVVVYDHSETSNAVTTATYVWTLFKLFGHQKTTILNGGLKDWKRVIGRLNEPTYQSTSVITRVAKDGNLDAIYDSRYTVGYSEVEDAVRKGKTQIVDTRTPDDFKGTTKAADAKEGGRIKGAVNAPFDQILTDDGALKNLPDLKKWLTSKNVDVRSSIVYDNSAVQASALFFVMTQAGYDAKLYDGGWIEYSYKAPNELKERG